MSIRNGAFQNANGTYSKDFYDMLAEYEKKLTIAAQNTKLPDEPNLEKIQDFVMKVNEKVVRYEF